MNKRRKFSKEFKEEAVRMASERGRTVSEVSTHLGIDPSLLVKWRQVHGTSGSEAFRGNGNRSGVEQELFEAKQKIRQLEQEREILKKAAAYFAKHLG